MSRMATQQDFNAHVASMDPMIAAAETRPERWGSPIPALIQQWRSFASSNDWKRWTARYLGEYVSVPFNALKADLEAFPPPPPPEEEG